MRSLLRFATGVAVACVPVAVAVVEAQNPPLRTISKMDLEYAEPFSCISGFRELSNGRVIVSDAREKTVQLIDLRSGRTTKIGREGQGPGEWSTPMTLLALPADTTLLHDPQNNRFLTINPDGTTGEAIKVELSSGTGFAISRPRGVDREGRLYFEGSSVAFTPGGGPPVPADSVPFMRYDRRAGRLDTLGFMKVPKVDVQTSSSGNRRMVMMMAPNAFNPQSTWNVLPDGRIGIVHPEPYRVEWLSPTRARIAGPAVPYQKIKVTDADKQGNAFPDCNAVQITRSSGGSPAAGARIEAVQGARPAAGRGGQQDYPEFKPPFIGRPGNAVAGPNGELWVLCARAANDDLPVFDVFNAAGQLSARMALPKKSTLVGFGNGTVYLSRMDEDDLVYLQRYRLDAQR